MKSNYCPYCGQEKIKPEYPTCRDCYYKRKKTSRKTPKKNTNIGDQGGIDFNELPFSVILGGLSGIGLMVFTPFGFAQSGFIGLVIGVLYWYFVDRKPKKPKQPEWVEL